MSSVPEEIIIKALQKTASEEEMQLLNSWLRKDKQHIALYCEMEEIWNSKNRLTEETIQEGWHKLYRDMKAGQQKETPILLPQRQTRFLWMRYVAAVFIGILIGSAAWISFQPKEAPIQKELLVQNKVYNQNGVQTIVLPDSSEVWLNENSSISYPEQFEDKERLVSLIGNAYFDIQKNTTQPFVVRIGKVNVKVTGTEFFIESATQNNTLITLISGSVDLNYENEKGESISSSLLPGQQADISKLNGKVLITDVDTDYYVAWKDGTYRFTDDPLDEIVSFLARHYDLNIQIAPSLQKKRFTGRVTSTDTLPDVLKVISESFPIKYRITGKVVEISDR